MHAAINHHAIVGSDAVCAVRNDLCVHARAQAHIIVGSDAGSRLCIHLQHTLAAHDDFSFAENGGFLRFSFGVDVVGAIRYHIPRPFGKHHIHPLFVLAIDSGAVRIMDRCIAEFDAEFILAIHLNRPIAGAAAHLQIHLFPGDIHREVCAISENAAASKVAAHRGIFAVEGNVYHAVKFLIFNIVVEIFIGDVGRDLFG